MKDQVIDFHVHPKMGAEALIAEMDTAGVDRAVILAVETDPADIRRPDILERSRLRFFRSRDAKTTFWSTLETEMVQRLTAKVTNQVVADLVAAQPDRFIGFGSVNLSKDAAYVEAKLEEIERFGLRGIKLLPFNQFFDPATSENFFRLCAWCEEKGRPILIHTGSGPYPWAAWTLCEDANPDRLRPALEKFHKVPIVMAHTGSYSRDDPGIWFEEAMKLGSDFPNVYGDLAAVAWLVEQEYRVERIRETIGFKKILFASDYPAVANQVSIRYMIDLIRENTFLDETEKRDILGQNAARILGLEQD